MTGTVEVVPEPRRGGAEQDAAERHGVLIVATDCAAAETIATHLRGESSSEARIVRTDTLADADVGPVDVVAFVPSLERSGATPDLGEAEAVFRRCSEVNVSRFVLVASAAVYGASFRNAGLLTEAHRVSTDKYGVASQWVQLEAAARRHFEQKGNLTVLRCATVLFPRSANPMARKLRRNLVFVMPGHDPCIQLLSPRDLAQAIQCVVHSRASGVFNVAPDGVLPWREALRLSGIKAAPIPRTLQRFGYLDRTACRASHLDYERYCWTISNKGIKELGFRPLSSSVEALAEFRVASSGSKAAPSNGRPHRFDDFGMDKEYIDSYSRTLFRFLAERYWRIEVAGLEFIPRQGRGLLAGLHRGFMPFDGVMALHLISTRIGRYPRFLIHPGLVKFPFLANFMTKLGGIIACQQNADYVLEGNELLGVFPEGIRGAFIRYSHAYRVQNFHRDSFVKIALRHRAPIVPFVTVGSAEIFPVLGEVKSRWWTRHTDWPAFPITPTFPLIPVPLPSKWHMRFLPAIHVEQLYPPSAARDPIIVRNISQMIKTRMQAAVDEMLAKRRSLFFGSIFPAAVQ